MTEHHDLRILGRLVATEQEQPVKDPDHDQIKEATRHKPRSCPTLFIWPNRSSQAPASSSDAVQSSALAASPRALPAAAPPTGYTWAATAGSSNAASPGCTPSNGSAPATNTAPTSTWACFPAPRHRRNESTSSVRVLGRLCGRHRLGERLPQPPDGLQIGRGGGLPPLAGSLPGLGVHLLVAGRVPRWSSSWLTSSRLVTWWRAGSPSPVTSTRNWRRIILNILSTLPLPSAWARCE
jgi:hypothetical protein